MREVYIAEYVRTPFSRSRPQQPERDVFCKIRGDELMALVLEELVKRANIDKKVVDRIHIGCAMQIWENWGYGGKMASILARFPHEVSTTCVDMQCASSLMTAGLSFLEIASGICDVVIAGGFEHMTRVPMGADNPHRFPNPRLLTEEFKDYKMDIGFVMGLTAEELFKLANKEFGITKEDMDRWGVRSHQYAAKAQKEGYFKGEIMPVEAEQADGRKLVVDSDQSVRPDTTLEQVAKLPPAFKPDGVITAGNSSPLNAGATGLLLMSKEKVKEFGIEPIGKIKTYGAAGVPPWIMGSGPVPACQKALEKANLKVRDISFWEINEAFAIVPLYAIKKLNIDPEIVNIKGGAIAIGHPLGASGGRLIGTCARILQEKGGDYGIATACVGGGQGMAVVIERV
ncbi:MAG: acetyl-CoA C-acetyltransferase [Archaeoglobales archaeon]|jgi:acetyl-CoA C-acetyltransferase|nr:acetyl-CoA C-acetyltransferase [Archaeoglobales archaeon]TDA25988.1 MAG: acetyl-CoA C-acetyltransferase [Archaeoglobi archaeon]TDA29115.1 MAG: acetyl-CoA C-acetyltransferase [Archaeoglobi archaeon]